MSEQAVKKEKADATGLVERLFRKVRQEGAYLERPYQTIGGMWTVDTWILGAVKAQLMDEGATSQIVAEGLRVSQTCNFEPRYYEGCETDLLNLADSLGLS